MIWDSIIFLIKVALRLRESFKSLGALLQIIHGRPQCSMESEVTGFSDKNHGLRHRDSVQKGSLWSEVRDGG